MVWRKDLYDEEGYSQLNENDAFYQQQRRDQTNKLNKTIIQVIDNEIEQTNFSSNASKLTINHAITSLLYMLPRIHKANNPGRRIFSAVSCSSSHIALFLDSILTPIVKQLSTYVQDTSDALRIFSNFHFTGEHRYLFTMDVKSLYTVIPNSDGLTALKHFLDLRPTQNPPTSTLLRLAELVLTSNGFSLDDKYYVQVGGIAMVSKFGPSFACPFVGY